MLNRLFGRGNRQQTDTRLSVVRGDRPGVPIRLKVAMIVHDPPIPERGGAVLSRVMDWYKADMLAEQYIADLRACSGGLPIIRL